jgi:hypothetical protein
MGMLSVDNPFENIDVVIHRDAWYLAVGKELLIPGKWCLKLMKVIFFGLKKKVEGPLRTH